MSVNWSDEPWVIGGLNLTDFACGIETISGDGLPERRGTNVVVPYNIGTTWTPKTLGERHLTLLMWISDMDGNGLLDSRDDYQLAQARANREALLKVLGSVESLLPVTRTVQAFSGGVPTPRPLTALAEVSNALTFQEVDGWNTLMYASVDLALPDPRWYGVSTAASATLGAALSLTNPGNTPADVLTLRFYGPLSNPILTNSAVSPANWVKLGSDVAAGDHVDLVVDRFTAIRASDSANLIGAVSRSGGRRWMRLLPGVNSLQLTAGSGTGYCQVVYSPPYLL